MKYTKIAAILFTAMLAATAASVNSYAAEVIEATELEQESEKGTDEATEQKKMEELLNAEDNIADGVIDEDYGQITWVIDSTGKLTVTGTGDVADPDVWYYSHDAIPWYSYREEILCAEIDVQGMTNAAKLFYDCSNLTSVDFSNFDTSTVTNMEWMFYNCSSLTELNVSDLDTSSVTNMSCIFSACKSLTSLDLSGLDTSSVTDMSHMFSNCKNLASLDLSTLDTGNVTDMSSMFYGCDSLVNMDLSSLDTENVTSITSMFFDCDNLMTVNFGNFDTSNITYMNYMFWSCENLTSVDLAGFDTGNVKNMSFMFYDCKNLTSLDVSNFDTSSVTDMSYMFGKCENLTSLDVSNFDTSSVTDMMGMFEDCNSLLSLDVSNFDTSSATIMAFMFCDCSSLTSLDVSSFDTGSVTDMMYMFEDCNSLLSLDVSSFDTSSVTNMMCMFEDCNSLLSLDVSNFDMGSVKVVGSMLKDCSSVKQIQTPVNCNVSVELPVKKGEFWQKEDETEITELPQGLSESITINKIALVENVFDDVAAGAWYTDAVQYVYDNGIMEGNESLFTPNGKMTRGMFVTTLYRLAGEPEITDRSACTELNDVAENAWYTDAVCWAYSTKVTTGYESDSTFRTNTALTREQLATFLYRFAEEMELDTTVTDDLSGLLNADKVKPYAEKEVKWAVGAGLIGGLELTDADGTVVYDLAPQGTATRAQMASILQRFMGM